MAPPPGPVYSILHSMPIPSLPYNIERWIPGSTPLSTTTEVVLAIGFYLVVIFGGQALMRGSKPYRESRRRCRGFVRTEKGRVFHLGRARWTRFRCC